MQPIPPDQIDRQIQGLPDQVAFDVDKFDRLIRAHGATFVHWRAMRCPVGLGTVDDFRRPHDDHEACSNGFMYTRVGEVTILFSGNSKETARTEIGLLGSAVAQVTFPRFYDRKLETDPEIPVNLAPFDRLYLAEESITVVHWQLFEASTVGVERLSFPAVDVVDLVDSSGNRYDQGVDFEVTGRGQIKWVGQRRPGFDHAINKGQVCAVRFNYRPYFYVERLIHEIRVAQKDNIYTGVREVVRLPQSAMIVREKIFENQEKDSEAPAPADPRQVQGPPVGGFTAR